jgi:hypothetical protein
MVRPTHDDRGGVEVDAYGFLLHADPRPLCQHVRPSLQGPGGRGQVQTAWPPPPHQLQQLVPVGWRYLGRRAAGPLILQSVDPVRARFSQQRTVPSPSRTLGAISPTPRCCSAASSTSCARGRSRTVWGGVGSASRPPHLVLPSAPAVRVVSWLPPSHQATRHPQFFS